MAEAIRRLLQVATLDNKYYHNVRFQILFSFKVQKACSCALSELSRSLMGYDRDIR